MRYFIVSQNLTKSNLKLPPDAILRVNLAWHKDLNSVREMLNEHSNHDIFLDIPIGRKKPPNHNHNLDDIADIANGFSNVKYVGISNVDSTRTISYYSKKFYNSKIVPKIESYKGIMNCLSIINALDYKPAIIMLDHEDLYSDLVHHKKEKGYLKIIKALIKICKAKKAHLLRTKGIIFSDD